MPHNKIKKYIYKRAKNKNDKKKKKPKIDSQTRKHNPDLEKHTNKIEHKLENTLKFKKNYFIFKYYKFKNTIIVFIIQFNLFH